MRPIALNCWQGAEAASGQWKAPALKSEEKEPRTALWVLNLTVGVTVIAALSVAFAISFAALVYKGSVGSLLPQGIGVTLLGAAVVGLLGSFSYSFRGTVIGPQDVTAILLGGAVSAVAMALPGAPQQTLLSSVLVLVGGATVLAGAAAFLFGRLRLGYLARYVPYPVVGGFLAATGYLLAVSAFGMMIGDAVSIFNLAGRIIESDPVLWVPWMLGAAAIAALTRAGWGDLALPVTMLLATAVFYIALAYSGHTVAEAQAAGLLLGPFENFGITDIPRDFDWKDVAWGPLIAQAPTLLAIAGLAVLGSLLNSTGIEMGIHENINIEKDLRATGMSNLVSGCVGGLPSYQLIGETFLARSFGLPAPWPGLAVAGGCLFALTAGAQVFSYLPVGVMAMLIAYLGFDLLATWLFETAKRLNRRDYAVIVVIVVAAAFVGFLEAIAVGILAAIVIFVLSYAQLDAIRVRSTAATRRSRVERSDSDVAYLSQAGSAVVILELSGFLFFGSAQKITQRAEAELATPERPQALFLDFRMTSGFDASAGFALRKLVRDCAEAGVDCVFSGMRDEMQEQYRLATPEKERARLVPTLDRALEAWERDTIAARPAQQTARQDDALLAFFEFLMTREKQPAAVSRLSLGTGDVLVAEGSRSNDIFVLLDGRMRAEVTGAGGTRVTVARFQPGALLGEIAYYADVPRTATVVAEENCIIYKLDPDVLLTEHGDFAARFHSLVASHIAKRLMRVTQMVKEAGI